MPSALPLALALLPLWRSSASASIAQQGGGAAPQCGERDDDAVASLMQLRETFTKLAGRESFQGAGLCNFDQAPWSEYTRGPLSGTLVFFGNSAGQGLGNVAGGIAAAMQLALATKRRFLMDYELGGVRLEDVVPARAGGPDWVLRNSSKVKCSERFSVFDFMQLENATGERLLATAGDPERYPTLCYEGNFGHSWLTHKVVERMGVAPNSLSAQFGCALNFVFDVHSLDKRESALLGARRPALSRGVAGVRRQDLQLAGHLRLGDGHLLGKGGEQRGVLMNGVTGLGEIDLAADAFVDCLQGLAARYMPPGGARKTCEVVFLSDSAEARRHVLKRQAKPTDLCSVFVDSAVQPKHSIYHTMEKSEAQETVREMFQMGSADVALTTLSGFGLSGARMGPTLDKHAFSFDFILTDWSAHTKDLRGAARKGALRQVCQTQKLTPIT